MMFRGGGRQKVSTYIAGILLDMVYVFGMVLHCWSTWMGGKFRDLGYVDNERDGFGGWVHTSMGIMENQGIAGSWA